MMGLNWISDALNWIVTLGNTWTVAQQHTPQVIKDRMPGWLGLGTTDEDIFAAARLELTPQEDADLTVFLHSLEEHERRRLILAVAGMPPKEIREETKIPGAKGQQPQTKTKITSVSTAAPVLKRIAQLVADAKTAGDNPVTDRAKMYCLSGRLIIEDPILRRAGHGAVSVARSAANSVRANIPIVTQVVGDTAEAVVSEGERLVQQAQLAEQVRQSRARRSWFNLPGRMIQRLFNL